MARPLLLLLRIVSTWWLFNRLEFNEEEEQGQEVPEPRNLSYRRARNLLYLRTRNLVYLSQAARRLFAHPPLLLLIHLHLTQSVNKVVLQKSIPAQIRQLILIKNKLTDLRGNLLLQKPGGAPPLFASPLLLLPIHLHLTQCTC